MYNPSILKSLSGLTRFMPVVLALVAPGNAPAQSAQEQAELDRLYSAGMEAYGGGDYQKALSAFEAGFELIRNAWPEGDPKALTFMNNLALLYKAKGNYADAEPIYLRVLQARELVLGKDHPDTLISLSNLAALYQSAGRYIEAEPLYLRALEASERRLGKDDPQTLTILSGLASLYNYMGRYSEAEPLHLRSLDGRERVLGKDHPDTLTSVNNLAYLYRSTGRYADAEPLYRSALQEKERVLGKDHPRTQISVNNLATLYQTMGRYAEAEQLYLRAQEASERALGKDHPDTLTSVNNLADLYRVTGRYAEAEPLFRSALQGSERALGKDHPDTLTSVNNLGALYSATSRYAEAEPLFQRALEGNERLLGNEHPQTLNSLNNLAFLYESMGRFSEAEPLYLRALEVSEQVLGRDHPLTLLNLSNLAFLYSATGRFTEAEPLYLRALEARERLLGEDHPDTLGSMNNLAALYYGTGRSEEAARLFRRALEVSKQVLGEEHPQTLTSLKNLSMVRLSLGDVHLVDDAVTDLHQGLQSQAQRVMEQLHSGAGAALRAQFATESDLRNASVSAALAFPDHAELGARALLLTKGVAGETDAALSRLITNDPRPVVKKAAQALRQAEGALFAAEQSDEPARIQPALAARDAARQALFGQIDPPLVFLPQALSPQAIADALTNGQVFLDYGIYRPVDFTSGQAQAQRVVLATYRPGQPPELFDLGPADALLAAILTLSDMDANHWKPLDGAQTLLSKALLGPVANLLAEADEVIIAPDGILARINFATLSDPQDTDLHLSERLSLRIVASGRSLLDQAEPAPAVPVLFLGAALQDYGPYDAEKCTRNRFGDANVGLCPLPNAVPEVEQISAMFNSRGKAQTLLRDQATEDAIRSALPGTRFVHLATHGGLRLPGLIGSGGGLNNVGLAFHQPLANSDMRSTTPANDGILTGAEASRLPLWGTDLVVLSACDTALGEDAGAEGIWSMAHGFRLAGVSAVMMTLWKVNDDTAPQFMERFYQTMLERRQTTPDEDITNTLRTALRETRLWAINEGWNYWDYAPFVLVESQLGGRSIREGK